MGSNGLTPRRHHDSALTFEELYNKNFAGVNRYLRYRLANAWDADDLTALVFTKALEKFHTWRGRCSFSTWLFRIAHNAYLDYTRGNRQTTASGASLLHRATPGGNPEEQVLLDEEMRELHARLNKLPPVYRDVLTLRYAGELRFSQIAGVLGKTETAVRMIHYRALKMLRRHYETGPGKKQNEK
jgi:RNA polymerase sigma-70 factor (ECF subfamily)